MTIKEYGKIQKNVTNVSVNVRSVTIQNQTPLKQNSVITSQLKPECSKMTSCKQNEGQKNQKKKGKVLSKILYKRKI